MTSVARTKKLPPQSAEDIELAEETITAAFADVVEQQRTKLAEAEQEVLRLQHKVAAAEGYRDAWVLHGEIDEDRAVPVWQFANRDMHALGRRFPHAPPARAEVDAARRKNEVTKRYLADHDLLPAELVENWRRGR